MRLRDATDADLDAIVAIYNAAIPGRLATADLDPVSVASKRAWFEEHGGSRPLWVLESEAGDVAAWLSFEDFYGRVAYRRTAEVSVYVAPEHHGQGLGRQLLATAIERAPDLGLAKLVAFVFGHNDPSVGLFTKHGFEPWGRLPDVAELDGVLRDLVILGRSVDRSPS